MISAMCGKYMQINPRWEPRDGLIMDQILSRYDDREPSMLPVRLGEVVLEMRAQRPTMEYKKIADVLGLSSNSCQVAASKERKRQLRKFCDQSYGHGLGV